MQYFIDDFFLLNQHDNHIKNFNVKSYNEKEKRKHQTNVKFLVFPICLQQSTLSKHIKLFLII